MNRFLFFLTAILSFSPSAPGAIQWAVSQNHLCLISSQISKETALTSEVVCWDAKGTKIPTPPLKNPRQVVTGYHLGGIVGDYSCALTDEGVRCWGEQGARLNRFFATVANPTLLASGFADICVANAEGVSCYGSREIPWTAISKQTVSLKDVVELSVGTFYACALTRTKEVKCWGGVDDAYLKLLTEPAASDLPRLAQTMQSGPEELESPSSLSVGLSHACLVDRGRPVCWGIEKHGELQPPAETAFREVQAGTYQTCGISFGNLVCWGLKDAPLETLQKSANASSVSVRLTPEGFPAFRNYCVVDENRIVCSGKLGAGFTIPHSAYGYSLTSFEDELDRISYYVYQNQRPIFRQLSQYLKQDYQCGPENRESCLKARVLVMLALTPLMESITSEYFQTAILPRFQAVSEIAQDLTGVRTLKQAGYDKPQLRAALKTLATVVLSLRDQLKDSRELEALTAFQVSVGMAWGTSGARPERAEVYRIGSELAPLWKDLAANPRTSGASVMIQGILRYLETP